MIQGYVMGRVQRFLFDEHGEPTRRYEPAPDLQRFRNPNAKRPEKRDLRPDVIAFRKMIYEQKLSLSYVLKWGRERGWKKSDILNAVFYKTWLWLWFDNDGGQDYVE